MRNAEDLIQYYRRQRRRKKRDKLFFEYVSKWGVSTTMYLIYLLCIWVLYFTSPTDNWSVNAKFLILSEIVIKATFLVVRTIILMLGKFYLSWILLYKLIRPLLMAILFIWNLIIMWIATISLKDCKFGEGVNFIIKLIIVAYDFMFFTWTLIYFMWWVWDKLIPEPNQTQVAPINNRQEEIDQIVQELK